MTGTQPETVQTASTAAVARAMAREDDLPAAFTDEQAREAKMVLTDRERPYTSISVLDARLRVVLSEEPDRPPHLAHTHSCPCRNPGEHPDPAGIHPMTCVPQAA